MTTSSAQDAQAVSAQAKAPWETHLDTDILPDQDAHIDVGTIKLLEVLRSLLKAPEDDSEAADRAVAEYQQYYHTEYLDEDSNAGFYLRQNGALLTDDIVQYSWELASYFPSGSVNHARLVNFVAGFKRQSPETFDPKDPKIVFDDQQASIAARESWSHLYYGPPVQGQSMEDFESQCNMWLSAAGFMASLLDLGVLGVPEIWDTFKDFDDGLKRTGPDRDDPNHVLFWQCQASVAAQYILLAGRVIAQEVQHPTEGFKDHPTAETWRQWATALDKIAETVSEEAHWDLFHKAKLAHDKMVQLSELFERV